jgi:transposase-like protein
VTWPTLKKCDGPECPYCGCEDTEKRKFGVRWGQAIEKWVCGNCGSTFMVQERKPEATANGNGHHQIDDSRPKLIVYPLMRCPEDRGGCGSTDTKVTSTRRPVRHHKCKACGYTFKSVEEGSEEVIDGDPND